VRDRRSLLKSCALGGAALGGAAALAVGGRRSPTTDRREAGTAAGDGPTTALVAGSLLGVATGTEGAAVEAHGSAAVRRLVVNGLRSPDAVALADPRLFAGVDPDPTLFATNALVLAYRPGSEYAGRVERDPLGALTASGVRIGRTDPDRDPLGYRTVMALDLLADRGVDPEAVLGRTSVHPETTLLPTLAEGKLDAAFAYRSMAVEADLPYADLPDRANFSSPAHAAAYAEASYDLDGRRIRGAPIRYAAAARTDAGRAWTRRLVTAGPALRAAGFGVPEGYPTDDAPGPATPSRDGTPGT
jgi:molybdate/tungstate transport system substrate-binding protein